MKHNTHVSIFERYSVVSTALIMLIITLLFLGAVEFGFRFVRDWAKGSPWIARAENVDDPELGWALNPDKKSTTKTNACGETVVRGAPVSRYLNKAPRFKDGLPVLFVGDSFTQGTEVSSGDLYYDVFEKNGGGHYAVWAAGVGGFSTAQEYLLLNKVFDLVKPRIIIWQMSDNDVAENVYIGTDISTVQKPRTYYDPLRDSFALRNPAVWILQHSEAAKYLYGELMKVDRSHPFGMQSAVVWLTTSDSSTPIEQVERRGLEVARTLIKKAINAHPNTLFIGFDSGLQYDRDYQQLVEQQGGLYVSALTARMRKVSPARLDCGPIDSHWNRQGNRIAGELLLQYLDQSPRRPQ